ncbi:MG2 domain-containing protein [Flexithrix dorotheae]|uniref:MG2 domain-containing protein n=1 Tax=Flexithrix dorotheae TaxID=70993 RepID=UPI0003638C57|nr:MG2 domain-containing protein [Flexithrix dorotheae]
MKKTDLIILKIQALLAIVLSGLLLGANTALAQSPGTIDELIDKFENGVSGVFQEKVFIHTDKPLYMTGETMWMKAYCVDATTHFPSDYSKVLNIEILDSEGKALKQTRIQLKEGMGKGQFLITPDLGSGPYQLRAYTSWMRNFDADFYYTKSFSIVNPPVALKEITSRKKSNEILIDFFPEGGYLVEGLESKIGVKATDGYGNGKTITGFVLDDSLNIVTQFSTSALGFSTFNFKPGNGQNYTVVLDTSRSSAEKYALPKPQLSGYVMAAKLQDSQLTLDVKTSGIADNQMYLVIHSRGLLLKADQLTNVKGSFPMSISTKNFPEGILTITLLNGRFQPICERLVFNYDGGSEPLQLATDKDIYAHREKVKLNLQLDTEQLQANKGALSIAVYRHLDEEIKNSDNIISSLLFTSDLKGDIQNPEYYCEDIQEKKEAINLLLMTQGWRRFNWDNLFDSQEFEVKFPPELRAPIISGKIKDPNPNQTNFTGFYGKSSTLSPLIVNDDGTFHQEIPFRITNSEDIFFWREGDTLQVDDIDLISSFDEVIPEGFYLKNNIKETFKEALEQANANIQISQIYLDETKISGVNGNGKINILPFYGEPEKQYYLDRYTRFEDMNDLFIEYIRAVLVRKRKKESNFYVVKAEGTFLSPALALLDGIPIEDHDYILTLSPLKIEKIDVVDKTYSLGEEKYEGVINFISYNGDLGGIPMPENIAEKVYTGLQSPRIFYSPDYEISENKHTPDFRNLLYWNPEVIIGKSGEVNLEFFTADDIGNYKVEVNGITANGQPFYQTLEFSVGEKLAADK